MQAGPLYEPLRGVYMEFGKYHVLGIGILVLGFMDCFAISHGIDGTVHGSIAALIGSLIGLGFGIKISLSDKKGS
jgi:hypothetical protein